MDFGLQCRFFVDFNKLGVWKNKMNMDEENNTGYSCTKVALLVQEFSFVWMGISNSCLISTRVNFKFVRPEIYWNNSIEEVCFCFLFSDLKIKNRFCMCRKTRLNAILIFHMNMQRIHVKNQKLKTGGTFKTIY